MRVVHRKGAEAPPNPPLHFDWSLTPIAGAQLLRDPMREIVERRDNINMSLCEKR